MPTSENCSPLDFMSFIQNVHLFPLLVTDGYGLLKAVQQKLVGTEVNASLNKIGDSLSL